MDSSERFTVIHNCVLFPIEIYVLFRAILVFSSRMTQTDIINETFASKAPLHSSEELECSE